MCNKKLTRVLLGVLIFWVVIYANSFSQAVQKEQLSFNPIVTSPTDTHCTYKPGDANVDGKVNLADIRQMFENILKAAPLPYPRCVLDVNGDGKLTLLDVVYLINYLFRGGPAPVKSGVCCL